MIDERIMIAIQRYAWEQTLIALREELITNERGWFNGSKVSGTESWGITEEIK